MRYRTSEVLDCGQFVGGWRKCWGFGFAELGRGVFYPPPRLGSLGLQHVWLCLCQARQVVQSAFTLFPTMFVSLSRHAQRAQFRKTLHPSPRPLPHRKGAPPSHVFFAQPQLKGIMTYSRHYEVRNNERSRSGFLRVSSDTNRSVSFACWKLKSDCLGCSSWQRSAKFRQKINGLGRLRACIPGFNGLF